MRYQAMLTSILQRDVDITEVTDSETAFNVVSKISNTLEKRLLVDVHALQESHRTGELKKIMWVRREYNISDPLTHQEYQPDSSLCQLMRTNELILPAGGFSQTEKRQKRVSFHVPEEEEELLLGEEKEGTTCEE